MNYNNLSSWRQHDVHCKQGVNDICFNDTTPNMFVIQNSSNYPLMISIGHLPSEKSYDFYVGKHSTMSFGRPIPTRNIYVFHNANVEIDIKLWSVYDNFDVNILKQDMVRLEYGIIETEGILKGFAPNVSLPSGKNNIGLVDLDTETIEPIIESMEGIQNVEVENWKKLLSAELQADVTNLKSVTNSLSDIAKTMPKMINKPCEFNGMYDITDSTGLNICSPISTEAVPIKIMDRIEMLSNLSDNDITVKLFYSFANYIELKVSAHDFISDINMPIYNIGVKVDTGTSGKISLYGGLF